jgi:gliding motility-associated-like protein
VDVNLRIPNNPLCSNDDPFLVEIEPVGVPGVFEGLGVSANGRVDPSEISDSSEIRFIYGGANCLDTAKAIIYGRVPLTIELDAQGPYCLTDSIFQLEATPPGGVWLGSVDTEGRFNPLLLGEGNFIAKYQLVDPVCTVEDSLIFEIISIPDMEFVNWESSFQLDDPVYDFEINPNNLSGSFSGPGIIDMSQGLFSAREAGIGQHRISYTFDENGCTFSIDSTLEVLGDWYVPNVFTPNGDGINDEFGVMSLPPGNWTLKIFNRWGSLLFETRDPSVQLWNGRFRGQLMGTGVYAWSLSGTTLQGTTIIQKGTVTLVL